MSIIEAEMSKNIRALKFSNNILAWSGTSGSRCTPEQRECTLLALGEYEAAVGTEQDDGGLQHAEGASVVRQFLTDRRVMMKHRRLHRLQSRRCNTV